MIDDMLSISSLDSLCPMHVVLDATGQIEKAGPTLHKIIDGKRLIGLRFLDLFELRRPQVTPDISGLRSSDHLRLRLTAPPRLSLNGVVVAVPEGRTLINLSFGISLVEAIRSFDLTAADFAATDLVTEFLFLIESKSAAMEALHKLTLRLHGARVTAVEQAFTDTLTGLGNRRALDHVLPRLIADAQDFALLHLDLDYFKQVNDRLGHAAGDHVLHEVSTRLQSQLREADLVARVGGDEFILILHGLSSRAAVLDLSMRLIALLEQDICFQEQACRISASIGATLACDHARPAAGQMIADADLALYAAKAEGRGCARIYAAAMRDRPPLSGSG